MDPPEPLTVRTTVSESSALVALSGEMDLLTAPQVVTAVDSCLDSHPHSVVIDASAVTFCDCAGVNALLLARKHTAALGGKLRLEPSQPVGRVLFLTGLAEDFSVTRTRQPVRADRCPHQVL